jgi:hypothetical protein
VTRVALPVLLALAPPAALLTTYLIVCDGGSGCEPTTIE